MNGVPINRDPSNNELQLIVALYSRGDFKKALSLSKQLCTRFPESAMPFNLCGAVHAALFEYDLAVESYAQAIKIDPTSADFYSNMASAQVDRGEIDGAIKSYQKAIEIDPNYAEAYSDLGLAFQKKDKLEEAIDCFNRALAIDSNFAEAHSNIANAMQKTGNVEAAINSCKRALEINPSLAAAHYNLGGALHQTGELDAALISYRRAAASDPNLDSAFLNSGKVLQDKGDLAGAIENFQTALSLNQNEAETHYSLGVALHDSGNLGNAHESYKRALILDPKHSLAATNLAKLLYENKQFREAAEIFSLNENSESQQYLLKCLYEEGSETAVLTQLKKLIDNGEKNAVIGSYVSRAHNRYGIELRNPYCQKPLNFVHHKSLLHIVDFPATFDRIATTLLTDSPAEHRAQTLLTNGIQTAGNVFSQCGELGREIEMIIRTEIKNYRKHFEGSNEGLIRNWPEKYTLSGWIVSMVEGGKLAAHMHDSGWLTGSIYITVPPKSQPDSGNLVVSSEDVENEVAVSENRRSIDVITGSLCLFPSSLLHYTRPFNAKEKRVVLAFDMIPL